MRRQRMGCRVAALALIPTLLAAACGPARQQPPAFPRPPDAMPRPALPPIPARDGLLALDLVYPPEGGRIAVRDSTFVFGSTGKGRARLTINGVPVPVQPNGTFLAFLPVPADGLYRLEATSGERTAQLERRVEVPEPPPSLVPDSAVILTETVFPQGAWTAVPGERIEVGFRGTAGGSASLLLPDGTRVPLVEAPAMRKAAEGVRNFARDAGALEAQVPGASDYRGYFVAQPLIAGDTAVPSPLLGGFGPGLAAARRRVLEHVGARTPAAGGEPMPASARKRVAGRAGRAPNAPGAGPTRLAGDPVSARAPVPRPTRVRSDDSGRAGARDPMQASVGAAIPALAGEPLAGASAGIAMLELVAAGDVVRTPLPLNLAILDPERPPVGVALAPEPVPDSAGRIAVGPGRVRASAGPDFVYDYFWPNGTRLMLTGERLEQFRVRLAADVDAWLPTEEVRLLPEGTPPPTSAVGTVRFTHYTEAIDVRVQLDERLPFDVHEDERRIRITLYGATSNTSWLQYGGLDPLIGRAEWSQPADGVYTLTLHLSRRLWGYRTFWVDGNDLVLRVRRPPSINAERPLEGLLIAVDPGHPPGGAIGPTRFTEAEANLAIARRLRRLLENAGARVLMTRTDTSSVGLYERTQMAMEANADLFVSVHNNAFPDGVNPFENDHTIVYYFYPHSADLAQALQRELFAELQLRDFGVGRASLAVVRRNSWMPAALTENMFLMVPQQEAALRNPEVQERIAAASVRGIEAFLRERASER